MSLFNDLFKSAGQRKLEEEEIRLEQEKAEERKSREAIRNAKKAISENEELIRVYEFENKKRWEKARECIKSGRKSAAQVEIQSYRRTEVAVNQCKKNCALLESLRMRLEIASGSKTAAKALRGASQVIKVDPNDVENDVDKIIEKIDELNKIDRVMNVAYASEMREDVLNESDVPNVDTLMTELEKEAALEVSGRVYSSAAAEKDEIARSVAEGREKLNKIIEDEVPKTISINSAQSIDR